MRVKGEKTEIEEENWFVQSTKEFTEVLVSTVVRLGQVYLAKSVYYGDRTWYEVQIQSWNF